MYDKDAGQMMFERGERDGLAGLNMSSTSREYHEGYIKGRRARMEKRIQFPWLNEYDEDILPRE